MKEETLDLYLLDKEFVHYMKTLDDKVEGNVAQDSQTIGIIFGLNAQKYFAPLAAPRPKHLHMKNTMDFHKLDGGRKGVINFNAMIPVIDGIYRRVVINNEKDLQYRRLLLEQYQLISEMGNVLTNKAQKLYQFRTENNYDDLNSDFQKKLFDRCCDYKALEKGVKLYRRSWENNKTGN